MKRFLCILAACGGGGGSTGDDTSTPDATPVVHKGTLTANWTLKNSDGSPGSCIAGYPTLKVTAIYWTKEFNAPEGPDASVIKLFDCAAGTGTMELPIDGLDDHGLTLNGKWDITLEQTDSTGANVIATDLQTQVSAPVTVDLNGGTGSMAATFYQDGGYAWFSWTLFGPTLGDYLANCTGAGVDKIDIMFTEQTSKVVKHLSFPCDRSDGLTSGADGVALDGPHTVGAGIGPLPAGDWDYIATAYAGSTAVGTSGGSQDTIVDPRNKIQIFSDLAEITLTNR